MTLFQPCITDARALAGNGQKAFEFAFIKMHAGLFVDGKLNDADLEFVQNIGNTLGNYIGRLTTGFLKKGVSIALCNIAALFEYGASTESQESTSIFRVCFLEVLLQKLKDQDLETVHGKADRCLEIDEDKHQSLLDRLEKQIVPNPTNSSSTELLQFASRLNFAVLTVVLRRPDDENVFSLVHVMLCFIWSLTRIERLMERVERDTPWDDICSFLNGVAKRLSVQVTQINIRQQEQLPEDNEMRGQIWSSSYPPVEDFDQPETEKGSGKPDVKEGCGEPNVEEGPGKPDVKKGPGKPDVEEWSWELQSMARTRIERIIWLGYEIASCDQWITYDEESMKFQPIVIPRPAPSVLEQPSCSHEEGERTRAQRTRAQRTRAQRTRAQRTPTQRTPTQRTRPERRQTRSQTVA
ncbi:MAG: hypothetical protein LQ346_004931 [Caloplaca aetnensis]|nr:MAG: hypothetical protein LQ346_004931 [Caloplaca aetnensis]